MTRRLRRLSAALALGGGLVACSVLPPAEAPLTSALIDQVPTQLPQRAKGTGTLLVFAPQARPAIDTQQMAYSLRAHHLAYFAQNQWAETPPQMLQPLLVRTLEGTGAFAAVVTPPYTGTAALALRTEILELVQDFGQDPPVLRLSLRMRLSDDRANRVLATREITLQQAMQQKGPQAGVAAANEAVARALRELAALVLENAP